MTPRDEVLVFVRQAMLSWPHADDMGSVERWEQLARHVTDYVVNRRTLKGFDRSRLTSAGK